VHEGHEEESRQEYIACVNKIVISANSVSSVAEIKIGKESNIED
jgi:hypothetical protein